MWRASRQQACKNRSHSINLRIGQSKECQKVGVLWMVYTSRGTLPTLPTVTLNHTNQSSLPFGLISLQGGTEGAKKPATTFCSIYLSVTFKCLGLMILLIPCGRMCVLVTWRQLSDWWLQCLVKETEFYCRLFETTEALTQGAKQHWQLKEDK